MSNIIKSLLLSSSICFAIFTPTILFADDCNVDNCTGAKSSDEIDCPGKGCGCYCDEHGNARCKCTQPLDENKTNSNTKTNN
ncbi:hypothetical protein OQJ26_18845 [Legionella sp. PATHC038]|uniref:hypothetical protein n=1 Tax=Legionella TaxID=445 RepID=UPI002242C931|nr:hypothetical protein [Legionella sp. PATHC038]MCW8400845.1 hypothetical protein [Legionella sp. PATHC038]